MNASAGGHAEVVCLLLDAGADQSVAGNDGCTALMMASLDGDNDVAKLLLLAGAHADVAVLTTAQF